MSDNGNIADKKAVAIKVPKEDPPKDEDEEMKDTTGAAEKEQLSNLQAKASRNRDNEHDEADDDLSEEDLLLKETLEELVTNVINVDLSEPLRKSALDMMGNEIRSSTSSMTAIPKPLKFLKPHFERLKDFYTLLKSGENKCALADILSVLSMTMAAEGVRDCLRYKLDGDRTDLGSWGHEYVSHLAGEIGVECNERAASPEAVIDDLLELVRVIVPFNIKHNAESAAIDLLMEVDRLSWIQEQVTIDNYMRVCQYLMACANYQPDAEDREKITTVMFECYFAMKDVTNAVRVALKCNDMERVSQCINAAKEHPLFYKQLGFLLGAQRFVTAEFEDDDDFMELMGNQQLYQHFHNLARELDVQEAKTPEDIYKSHLGDGNSDHLRRRNNAGAVKVDSAKQNLAATFVNAFVNCGFGKDKLVTPDGADWIYKNKGHGMMSAAASMGMVLMWDVDTGFSTIDKYSFSTQTPIKAGALLGTGIISCGVQSEMDAALGLLSEHVEGAEPEMKIAAIFGLALAYCGTSSDDVLEVLIPQLVTPSLSMEVYAFTSLALGMVFCGSANENVFATIMECVWERTETELNDSLAHIMMLGIGLLFLGKNGDDSVQVALTTVEAVEHPIKEYLRVTVETCSYMGTGSVLEIQKLLQVCGEHITDEGKGLHQAVAVLGIAMVSMGEELAEQMALRMLDHILQYGEVNVRRAIPLALGLLSVSNPQLPVLDTLSKLSHDQDEQVSQNAILAMGLIGAGTNNSRVAGLLRQLASYYEKEPNHLFLVRIAQGLLHLGKGLMTLAPFHSDRTVMIPVAACGLLALLHSCMDMKNSILDKRHFLLYSIVCAVRPRMLITLDENLESIPIKVKVGQAVDTVGQPGKPKSITGFQTHNTPVLLAYNERAELVNDEYIPYSNVLEGFVIVRKNPDAEADE